MAELKPCPFCGSKKIYFTKPTPYGSPGRWIASFCCQCGVELNVHTKNEQEAIDAWNKRS